MRSFITCTLHQILLRMIRAGHVTLRGEIRNAYKKSWSEDLNGRDHSEDVGVDGKMLEWALGKYGGEVWTGFNWLGIGTTGGLL
jgi:hypothetical protein